MSPLHTAVISAFESRNWHYQEVPGREVVKSSFETYHGKVPLHVQSFSEVHIISVVAHATLNVPSSHKVRVAELIMRANSELNLGAFELEWDSGQVMFRQGNLFSENGWSEALLTGLVFNAVMEMGRMIPFLGEVCRTSTPLLPLLDLRELLQREDLLPPAPAEDGGAAP